MSSAAKILVIDDDADIGEIVLAGAQALGIACTVTTTASDFFSALNPGIELLMIDLMMPEMDGIEILRALQERQCTTRIVLMSGVGKRVLETASALADSLGLSIAGHLHKPFRLAELQNVLQLHTQQRKASPMPLAGLRAITDEALRQAIGTNELELHYQPQIEIATGRLIGLEALVRWQHPQWGLVGPDEFIGRAEAVGLIDELGWLVADRGLADIKRLVDAQGQHPVLSLNVSVHTLHDLKFPEAFLALAEKHGVAPGQIILEITESGLIGDLSRALDIMTRLRMKGFQLSIDDFGTGYAMMAQLQHVPATELKIDKSFVQEMHEKDSARIVVQKTIEMAHELGMKVVAEGVETVEQLEFLGRHHCDTAQGYFFSRALPFRQLEAWIATHRSKR